MEKELLKETISFIEKLPNSEEKYGLLRKLYLEDAGFNKTSSIYIPKVNAIQALDEVIRRIYVGELSIDKARNFSQTEEFNLLLCK